MFKLAVDVGGTFTDVIIYNENTGELNTVKTPTTNDAPAEGVINGIEKILAKTDVKPDQINSFVHGTTFATNAFLEHKGDDVALLTTKGFRDVIEMARGNQAKLYDINQDRPSFIVERRFRFSIEERIGFDGEIIVPLNEDSVRNAVEIIKEKGITSIAIVYLHAYTNPEHEIKTAELINKWYPECHVSMSNEIAPEYREYERTITTAINAYLKPGTRNYFLDIANRVSDLDIKLPSIMKSNGGIMSIDTASHKVADTLLSGPAGGVIGASYISELMELDNIITLDMGGTSTDVSLSLNGSLQIATESVLNGYPLKIPMVEMETIGAGGGTIGWKDKGDVLKAGPVSAGAIPGPACYGNSGEQPTVTDANLLLGRIDPNYFLGGEMTLDYNASNRVFSNLTTNTNLDNIEAALGILKIANNNMIEAVKIMTIQRGLHPKDFTLFGFGGAAPLHCTEIAKELGIPQVVIPKASSQLSAFGLLTADTRHDFSITRLTNLGIEELSIIKGLFQSLEAQGQAILEEEGILEQDRLFIYRLDLRYQGQAYEITIELDAENINNIEISNLLSRFQEEYEQKYGYAATNEPIEIVTYRLSAIGKNTELKLKALSEGDTEPSKDALAGIRKVCLPSTETFKDIPVFYLNKLLTNNEISGPASIDGIDTTILIDEGQKAMVDKVGNINILIGGK